MSWLSSFIDHATTAPGTSVAQGQNQKTGSVQGNALDKFNQQSTDYGTDYGFYRSLMPADQSAIHSLLAMLSPGGQGQAVQTQWQKLLNQGYATGAQESNAFTGNPALQNAVRLDALNRANDQAGSYANQLGSPSGQINILRQILQTIGTARPSLKDLGTLGGLVYDRPQSKPPTDPFGALAQSALSKLLG